MTPAEGIGKNILLLLVLAGAYRWQSANRFFLDRWLHAVLVSATISICTGLMIFNQHSTVAVDIERPLNLDLLYTIPLDTPDLNLREGKYILAFLSLECKHCIKAAQKLSIIYKANPGMPIFFVLNGDSSKLNSFFAQTKASNVPHILFNGGIAFAELAGQGVPAIYWVSNSTALKKSNYFQLNPEAMKQWLAQD